MSLGNHAIDAPRQFATVLLAAGSSSRMGQPKQLLPINGKPLLLISVEAALGAAIGKTFVVLGANSDAHRKIIQPLPLEMVINPDWEKGMGTSLCAGVKAALEMSSELDAILIMVCDQPLVTRGYLESLILRYKATKKPIIASSYSGTVGVPALFNKSLFPKLLNVEASEGARRIIREEADSVASIDFPGGAFDLDTPQDYTSFVKKR